MKNRKRVGINEVEPMFLANTERFDNLPKKLDWKSVEKDMIEYNQSLQKDIKQPFQKPFVCIDTNIVIGLSGLTNNDSSQIANLEENGFLPYMQRLKKLIDENKVVAIVTPYVLQELYFGRKNHGIREVDYIYNSNLHILNLPEKEDVYYFEAVENLALRYCGRKRSPYAPHPREGRNRAEQIFPLEYTTKLKRPDIDARIFAEASLLRIKLITNNTLHFLSEDKDAKLQALNKKLCLGKDLAPITSKGFLILYDAKVPFPEIAGRYKNFVTPATHLTNPDKVQQPSNKSQGPIL